MGNETFHGDGPKNTRSEGQIVFLDSEKCRDYFENFQRLSIVQYRAVVIHHCTRHKRRINGQQLHFESGSPARRGLRQNQGAFLESPGNLSRPLSH